MRSAFILLGIALFSPLVTAQATPLGHRVQGKIVAMAGQPALCLPEDLKRPFALGWADLQQSFVARPPAWGIELVAGAKPLLLRGGECLVFGTVPNQYRVTAYKGEKAFKGFEEGATYFFTMTSFERPVDSYDATFCVGRSSQGHLEYHQYIHLSDGREIIPLCGQ